METKEETELILELLDQETKLSHSNTFLRRILLKNQTTHGFKTSVMEIRTSGTSPDGTYTGIRMVSHQNSANNTVLAKPNARLSLPTHMDQDAILDVSMEPAEPVLPADQCIIANGSVKLKSQHIKLLTTGMLNLPKKRPSSCQTNGDFQR